MGVDKGHALGSITPNFRASRESSASGRHHTGGRLAGLDALTTNSGMTVLCRTLSMVLP